MDKNLQSRLISYEPLWGDWNVEEAVNLHNVPHTYRISRRNGKATEFALIEIFNVNCNAFDSVNLEPQEVKQYLTDICNHITSGNFDSCKNIATYSGYFIKEVYSESGELSSYDVALRLKNFNCLFTEVKSGTKLSQDEVYNMLYDTANALCTGYSMGMIHNNLNIQNILIDDNGIYHLSGFDIYKLISPTYDIRQSQVNDISSLGTIAYQLLDSTAVVSKNTLDTLPPIDGINNQLMQVILKACQNNTNAWYTSTKQFFNDVKSLENVLFANENSSIPMATKAPSFSQSSSPTDDDSTSVTVPVEEVKSTRSVLRVIPLVLLCLILLCILILFGIKIVDTLSSNDSTQTVVSNNSLNDSPLDTQSVETSNANAIEYQVTETPETDTPTEITTILATDPITEPATEPVVTVPPVTKKYYCAVGNLTWNDAYRLAEKSGYELATFETEEEWNELIKVAEQAKSTYGVKYLWIGGQTEIYNNLAFAFWENGDDSTILRTDTDKWFVNSQGNREPSGYDYYNDSYVVETDLMLWNVELNGQTWTLCDNSYRVTEIGSYKGKIGYLYMDKE